MTDADIISSIRSLRQLVSTLDSIGFPVDVIDDSELNRLVPKTLPGKVKTVSSNIHGLIQKIEKSKRYKEAIKNLTSGDEHGFNEN